MWGFWASGNKDDRNLTFEANVAQALECFRILPEFFDCIPFLTKDFRCQSF